MGKHREIKAWLFEGALLLTLLISLGVLVTLMVSVVTTAAPVFTGRGADFLTNPLSAIASRAGVWQGLVGSLMLMIVGLNRLGGWSELRAVLGSDMFNLWKPIIPAGVEGTWLPVKEAGRMAWYFNQNFPWIGMLFCAPIVGLWYWCTDQYIVQRTLGAPNEQEARRGTIFAAFLKLLPVFIFIVPGMIALALARSGKVPGLAVLVKQRWQRRAVGRSGGVSTARATHHARRVARARCRRSAGGAHELPRRRIQCLVHALHDRLLSEVQTERLAGTARVDRACGDSGYGGDRAGVDSGDPGREGPV